MGYKGENKWIKEIDDSCNDKKCLLIIDRYKEDKSQISYKIINYVIDNYHFIKTIDLYDLYTNESNNKTDEK